MPTPAATPTGGAEGVARPQAPAVKAQAPQTPEQPSQNAPQLDRNGAGQFTPRPAQATVADRMKAAMFSDPEPDAEVDRTGEGDSAPIDNEQQAGDDTVNDQQATEESTADGAQDETQAAINSLNELADGLGWELEKVLDLEATTKINGKDGKVRLRDLVKSHQLEGHLNQGLIKLAEERKGFEAETARKAGEIKARVEQVNQAVTLVQKMLEGEFAGVDWEELQRTDPAAFQAKFGAREMRLAAIRQLSQQVQQESEQQQAQQQAAQQAYLAEQSTLLDSKVPEWADKGKREKDVAEMATILNESYGLTEQELRSTPDHRLILMARDATRWQKLQKSKPATLNKVRAAPKLIRPGTQQSRTAQDGLQTQKSRDQLRRTGRVQDAAPALKSLLFSN